MNSNVHSVSPKKLLKRCVQLLPNIKSGTDAAQKSNLSIENQQTALTEVNMELASKRVKVENVIGRLKIESWVNIIAIVEHI